MLRRTAGNAACKASPAPAGGGLRGLFCLLLLVAGLVVCVATVVGFLGRVHWFLDLFSHFRVQYLLTLAVLAVLLLSLRARKSALLLGMFAAINLALVAPLYWGGQTAKAGSGSVLRAMVLNINRRQGDPRRIRQAIEDADPDVLVLVELSPEWFERLRWLRERYAHSWIEARSDDFGIALFSKLPLINPRTVSPVEGGVPTIVATVDTGRNKLRLIAAHPLPPVRATYAQRRNEQLGALARLAEADEPVLLLGDLNTTPWNYYFRRLLKQSGLGDSSRGFGVQPTWPAQNPLFWIPIDHCLHSPEISIVDRRVGPNVGSDHYPLIVDFVVGPK